MNAPATQGAPDRRMLEFLVCPVTRGRLDYDAQRQELVSRRAGLGFPIQNGIPVMLVDEARRLDDQLPGSATR
jgi:uncharacterized protein YbaR (Trm112 family)